MRFSINRLFRRARRTRFSLPLSQPQRAKHIKIDDEESYSHDDFVPLHRRHRHRRPSPTTALKKLLKMLLFCLFGLILLVLVLAYLVYKPPTPVVKFLQWKYPGVLFHVPLPPFPKVVALTLDDAPSSETAQILDLLKAHNAKATFFIIGSQVAAHPDLLQRMHAEGHELGNHAWADEPSVNLPLVELEQQIKDVQALLPAAVVDSPKYFRPGSGFFNAKMVDMVKELGYKTVLGSIFPHDPNIPNPRINAAHVLSMLKPGGIIIMHDRRSYSPRQVELVLEGLEKGNWKAETLTGLLKLGESAEKEKLKT